LVFCFILKDHFVPSAGFLLKKYKVSFKKSKPNFTVNTNSNFKKVFKKMILFVLLLRLFIACENHRFDSDKRQIMAKDLIMNRLPKAKSFDITGFKEDKVQMPNDSNFKIQIRYSLDIEYLDSNKVFQKKKAIVMFTPDGKSIINSKIIDR